MLYADNFIADNGLIPDTGNANGRDESKEAPPAVQEKAQEAIARAKAESKPRGSLPPAVQQAPAQASQPPALVQQQKPAIVNHNKFDVIVINEIPIPNQYIVFYSRKLANGKMEPVPYIVGEGLEYLAGKMGLWQDPRAMDPEFPADKLIPAISVVPVRLPNEDDNGWGVKGDCVFEAIVRTKEGQVWKNYGTATAKNLNEKQKKYPIEMAVRRAKNRAIRTATNCNICSLEEMDSGPEERDRRRVRHRQQWRELR